MGFKCGIVGLPNVGKSTLFNALMQESQAQAANFPFCTIEPNVGVVAVPDKKLEVLGEISHGLESLVADGENILVVADAQGRVLWRSGSPSVLHNADRLGFIEGANWGEGAVGTNAIGTALVSQRAVQVFSAEHFLRSHHAWTCAGAPIRDPRTGHVLGVVDVSGPAATVHPTTIALVDAVERPDAWCFIIELATNINSLPFFRVRREFDGLFLLLQLKSFNNFCFFISSVDLPKAQNNKDN